MYKKFKNDEELNLVVGGLLTPNLKNKDNFFVPREGFESKDKIEKTNSGKSKK